MLRPHLEHVCLSLYLSMSVCVCIYMYMCLDRFVAWFDFISSRWWFDFRSNVNFIHEMYVRMHVHVPLIMSTTFFSPKNTVIIQRIYSFVLWFSCLCFQKLYTFADSLIFGLRVGNHLIVLYFEIVYKTALATIQYWWHSFFSDTTSTDRFDFTPLYKNVKSFEIDLAD